MGAGAGNRRSISEEMKMTEDEAKLAFPIGQKVAYTPVSGQPFAEETRIRSEPWTLGHGAVVIAVEGRSGGVSTDHLVALREPGQ